MDASALVQALEAAVPGAGIEPLPSADLHATLAVARGDLPAVARALWSRPELAFSLLIELTAIDHWPREPRFEVVYLLVSLEHRTRLRLRVRLEGKDPHVSSVSAVWPAANWLEREVWDLFGIAFDGHPDPRRLLMPEDWEGHPLRKDYPVQIRKTPQVGEPLQMSEEEFRANVQKDRLARRD
jgi:NADH-quinone oxidoreductase subunit C